MNYCFHQPAGAARLLRRLIEAICFALGLSACAALAGPHHFWSWHQGTITQLNPSYNRLVLVEGRGQKSSLLIEWNRQTRFSRVSPGATKPLPAAAAELADGVRVRVQTFVRWKTPIARQIIIESSGG